MITPETMREHRATWFVWSGDGSAAYPRTMIRHQATMMGTWGWDATCSCGQWASKTGGATKRSVEEALWFHRLDAQAEKELHAEARAAGYDPQDAASYSQFLLSKAVQR